MGKGDNVMRKIIALMLVLVISLAFIGCGQKTMTDEESTPEPTTEPTQEPTPKPTQEPTPEPTPLPLLGGDTDAYIKAVYKCDYGEAYRIVDSYINTNSSEDLAVNIAIRDKLLKARELVESYEITVDEFEGTAVVTMSSVGVGDGFAKFSFNSSSFYIAYIRVGYSLLNLNGIKIKTGEGDFIEYDSLKSLVTTKETESFIYGMEMYSESIWIETELEVIERMKKADAVTIRFVGDSTEDKEVDNADIINIGLFYELYELHLELLDLSGE